MIRSYTFLLTLAALPAVAGLILRYRRRAVRTLHPAYFAAVMSTGILSIAFEGLGRPWIARGLFLANVATYGVLLPMFAARILLFTDSFLEDLKDPGRSWGFLTFVVGTNTLGSQLFLFRDSTAAELLFGDPVAVSQGLWVVGLLSWVCFTYAIFCHLIAHHHGSVEEVISGASLLTVVGTQSVAVLGSQIASTLGGLSGVMELFVLTHFAAGWVLYLIIIVLVTYRLLFRRMEPADWTGPYWICMGAVAITTLAGSNMLLYLDMGNLYEPTLVVTFLAWAIGAWWIPIQLYMDVWKFTRIDLPADRPVWITAFPWARLGLGRGRRHFYEPLAWGRVFPMGMFTACTLALVEASDFRILSVIPAVWGWFALAVWALTAVGTIRALGSPADTRAPA